MTLAPYAPTLPQLAADEADALAAAWLTAYGPATRDAYSRDLRAWASHLATYAVDPLGARRHDVDAWARAMEADGLAASTRARRLAAVASFYRYCEDEGVIERNPAARARRPRVSHESPRRGAVRREVSLVLDAAQARSARDHALLALLALLGVRVSEAVGIDAEHLGTGRDQRGRDVATVRVTRKGGATQSLTLPDRAAEAVAAALGDRTTGPVLLARTGGRLSRRSAGYIVEQVVAAAELDHRCPHDFRHAYVTSALGLGVSVHKVARQVGHRNVSTTLRYDRDHAALDSSVSDAVAAAVAAA